MTIDTGKVQNRRSLHFNSLDEMLREAERLAAAPHVRSLGNWTVGQTLKHLAAVFHMAIDGSPIRAPWFIRLIGPIFLKKKFLNGGMPAGFKLPKEAEEKLVAAPGTTAQDGLIALRSALERFRSDPRRAPSHVFGKMTNEEWEKLQLRHAELHLSFLTTEG